MTMGWTETPKKRSWFGSKKDDSDKTAASAAVAEGGGGEGEGEEGKNTVEAPKKVSFVGNLFKKKQPTAKAEKEGAEVIVIKRTGVSYLNLTETHIKSTLS